jgi:hypothetical protein
MEMLQCGGTLLRARHRKRSPFCSFNYFVDDLIAIIIAAGPLPTAAQEAWVKECHKRP